MIVRSVLHIEGMGQQGGGKRTVRKVCLDLPVRGCYLHVCLALDEWCSRVTALAAPGQRRRHISWRRKEPYRSFRNVRIFARNTSRKEIETNAPAEVFEEYYTVSGGETKLDNLLRNLSAELVEGVFVFLTVDPGNMPVGLSPRMMFREAEGVTLILLRDEAEAQGLAYEFPCRMITLTVHSSLEAVGFIATVANQLAKHGMGVNPVSGFFHDHLFIPDGREAEAMAILQTIAQDSR